MGCLLEDEKESNKKIITRYIYDEPRNYNYSNINNSSYRYKNYKQPNNNNNKSNISDKYKFLYHKNTVKYNFKQASRDNNKKRNKNKRFSYLKKNNDKKNNNKILRNSINLSFPLEYNCNYNSYQPSSSSYIYPNNCNDSEIPIPSTHQYNTGQSYIITNDINEYNNNNPDYIQYINNTGINNDYSNEIEFINNDLNMHPLDNQIYTEYQSLPYYQQQYVYDQQNPSKTQIYDISEPNYLKNKNNNFHNFTFKNKNSYNDNNDDNDDNSDDKEDGNEDDNEDENEDENDDDDNEE